MDPAIRQWVESQAAIDGCSLSMVVNNALAWIADIEIADPLHPLPGV